MLEAFKVFKAFKGKDSKKTLKPVRAEGLEIEKFSLNASIFFIRAATVFCSTVEVRRSFQS